MTSLSIYRSFFHAWRLYGLHTAWNFSFGEAPNVLGIFAETYVRFPTASELQLLADKAIWFFEQHKRHQTELEVRVMIEHFAVEE